MTEPPTIWYYEYITPDLFLSSHLSKIVFSGQTKYQQIEIIDTVPFGRTLVLDGRTQSSEADDFIYHEALVHPGMILHNNPESVFIAGGGEGSTLREVLAHKSVKHVTMVDLDEEVVGLCKKYLPNHHKGSFEDKRLKLIFEDANKYLFKDQNRYDVIIIDIPDPLEGGPAYLLYTQEFYSIVKNKLKAGGLLVVQSGPAGPLDYSEVFTAINKTISTVFRVTNPYHLYMPSFGLQWGFVVAGETLPEITMNEIDSRIKDRISSDLKFYDGTTHANIFSLPKYLREGIANEDRIITKDNLIFAV